MNAFWVYIVECSDGKYYTGVTNDLERKVKGWTRRKKQALIDDKWELLPQLSVRKSVKR